MNESTPDHDAWQPCPPGEIGRMVGQLNTQRRRQQLMRFGGGVAALVLLAAVVIAGRGLLTSPSPSGPIYGGIACSQVMPLMQAYHDGTLAPGLAKKVRVHLEQCPNCGPKYRQMYAYAAVAGNAVKDLEAGFSRYVAVRSANVRIVAERKATHMQTVQRQNT